MIVFFFFLEANDLKQRCLPNISEVINLVLREDENTMYWYLGLTCIPYRAHLPCHSGLRYEYVATPLIHSRISVVAGGLDYPNWSPATVLGKNPTSYSINRLTRSVTQLR
jgi:hypothetical protein